MEELLSGLEVGQLRLLRQRVGDAAEWRRIRPLFTIRPTKAMRQKVKEALGNLLVPWQWMGLLKGKGQMGGDGDDGGDGDGDDDNGDEETEQEESDGGGGGDADQDGSDGDAGEEGEAAEQDNSSENEDGHDGDDGEGSNGTGVGLPGVTVRCARTSLSSRKDSFSFQSCR